MYIFIFPRSGARCSNDYHLWNIILYKNRKVDSVCGSTLLKICIIWENTNNKSCWALNSLQKSQWAHMSMSPRSGAKRFQRLHHWKIILYKYEKEESVCGTTLLKIRTIWENASNKSYWALNSVQKRQWAHMSMSPRSGAKGLQRLHLWNILYKYGKVESVYGSTLLKIRIIWENASNKSCWALNSVLKSQWSRMFISHQPSPGVEVAVSKDWWVSNFRSYWNG